MSEQQWIEANALLTSMFEQMFVQIFEPGDTYYLDESLECALMAEWERIDEALESGVAE